MSAASTTPRAGDLLLVPGRPPLVVVEECVGGYLVCYHGELRNDTRHVLSHTFVQQAMETGNTRLYRCVS
jgi:hypothetical protein